MAEGKSTEKSTDSRRVSNANLILWKPGKSANPKGRKLGTRNRKTVILEAIRKMADANTMSPEDVEELLQATGLQLAIKRGSFSHYKEISDALYGKITDKMDVTSGGMTLTDLIRLADAKPARGRKATG